MCVELKIILGDGQEVVLRRELTGLQIYPKKEETFVDEVQFVKHETIPYWSARSGMET